MTRILLVLFFLQTLSALGQNTKSLEECVQYALEHNLSVKRSRQNYKFQKEDLNAVKANQLPAINGQATNNYNSGRNIDPFTNQYTNSTIRSNNFSINGVWTIFNGFQVRNSIKQEELEYKAGSYDVKDFEEGITINIINTYLNILLGEEMSSVQAEQVALTRELMERTKKLVAAGVKTESSLIEIESQLAREEALLMEARNNTRLSYLQLYQLLEAPVEDTFKVVQPTLPEISVLADRYNITEEMITSRASVKAAEYRKLASHKAILAAKGRYSPRLNINSSVTTLYSSSSKLLNGYQFNGYNVIGITQAGRDTVLSPSLKPQYRAKPFNNQFSDNLNRFVGFNLSIPILNGFQARIAVSRSEIGKDIAEVDEQIARRDVVREIQTTYLQAHTAYQNMQSFLKAFESEKLSFENAQKRFDNGVLNSYDMIQFKTRLTVAQSQLIQAKYRYFFQVKLLEFYKNGGKL